MGGGLFFFSLKIDVPEVAVEHAHSTSFAADTPQCGFQVRDRKKALCSGKNPEET